MPKSDSEYRIGLYECQISRDRHVVLGNSLKTLYYERFTQDFVKSRIMPDLLSMKSRGVVIQYPVLVKSWRLHLKNSVPLVEPPYKVKGNLRETREALGMSPQREKIPKTETYRGVIDEQGNILQVDPNKNTVLPS